MNRFTRYLIVIIAVIAITALLIYSQTFTQGGQGASSADSSLQQSQTSDEIDSSESTEDSNDISSDTSEEDGSDTSVEDSSKEEHIHQAVDGWLFDLAHHWQECSCGESLEKSAHEFEYLTQENNEHAYFKKCACGYQEELKKTYISQSQELHLNTQVKDGQAIVNTEQTVCVSLDKSVEKIVFVKYSGREIVHAHCKNAITIFASEFAFDYGKAELEILTDTEHYFLSVLLITKQIQTKEDLDGLNVLSKACETDENKYGGYFTLADNINYNGIWQGGVATQIDDKVARAGQSGFCGVFDGRGYCINGIEQAGGYAYDAFIGVLCGGVIKNIKFASASLLYSGGFVCAAGVGEIENVCVEYAQFGSETDKDKSFGTFFGSWTGPGSIVKDCLIDCRAAQVYINRYGYLIGGITQQESVQDGVLQGVYVLGAPLMQKIVYNQEERTDIFGSYTNFATLQSDEKAKMETLTWNKEYWTIDEENIMFKEK